MTTKRDLMTHTLEPHDFKYLADSVKFCTMGDAECRFIDVRVDADIDPPDRSVGIFSAQVSLCTIETPSGEFIDDKLLTEKSVKRIEEAYLEWKADQICSEYESWVDSKIKERKEEGVW